MRPASTSGLLRTGGSSRSGSSRSIAGKDLDGSKMLLSVNWRFLKTADPDESIRATASRGSMRSQGSMMSGGAERESSFGGGFGAPPQRSVGIGRGTSVVGGVPMPSHGDVGGEESVVVVGSGHGGVGSRSGSAVTLPFIRSQAGEAAAVASQSSYGTDERKTFGTAGGAAGTSQELLFLQEREATASASATAEAEAEALTLAGEALLSESRLFSGGAAINDSDVLQDDEDGAIGKIMKVRFAREKLGAPPPPPPPPTGPLAAKEKALLTKLFNKRAGKSTTFVDIVVQAANKKPALGTFKSMSRKVNEATLFTMQLREVNASRMASFTSKPKLMMSEMEVKLQEVDKEAEALDRELMTEEERRQARSKNKLVRGVSQKHDLTGDDQFVALEGVQKARREGAVNLDLAIEDARSASPVFAWRPMARVTLATELPLELFEDDDDEVNRHVLLAELAMRQEGVSAMPTVAELAAPTGGAEWRKMHPPRLQMRKHHTVVKKDGGHPGEGQEIRDADEQEWMDDEMAKELALRRRSRAKEMSQRYDLNIHEAARRTTLLAKPMLQGPMSHGRNTDPQPQQDPAAKRRARHYGRWFLPTAQLSLDEYKRRQAEYLERVGGEQSRIQRELREKQRELDDELAPLHSARLYKAWLTGSAAVVRLPHYMKKIPVNRGLTRVHPELARQRKSGNFTAEDPSTAESAEDDEHKSNFMRRRASLGGASDNVDPFMMGGGIQMKV